MRMPGIREEAELRSGRVTILPEGAMQVAYRHDPEALAQELANQLDAAKREAEQLQAEKVRLDKRQETLEEVQRMLVAALEARRLFHEAMSNVVESEFSRGY